MFYMLLFVIIATVIVIVIVIICNFFYIGKTEELKQHTGNHKSDVNHPNNSDCKNVQNN